MLLGEIDAVAVAAHFGANIDKDDPAAADKNKLMETQRMHLKEAHFRKVQVFGNTGFV
jgi:hypothetical protein